MKILFSLGTKLFESDKNAISIRQIYENTNMEIISMDYEFSSKTIYFADAKTNKVNGLRLVTNLTGP
jgi:hypothetical protein